MVRLRHGAGVIAALGAVVLAGCGGGVSADGTPPVTSSRPTSTVSSAPSTSSAVPRPTPSGPGAPGVPAAARHHTKAGAIAFAKYYVKVVNEVGVKPKKGRLEPLSDPGCKTCKNFIKTVAYNLSHQTHFDGRQLETHRYYFPYSGADHFVAVVSSTPETNLIKKNGHVLHHYTAVPAMALIFDLAWSGRSGWRTMTIKYDKSVNK